MASAPSPSPSSATPVHDMAAKGFNVANDLYDRARPSYQPAVLSWIRKTVRKVDAASGKLNVLEVGAGTGIFTRALLAHPDWKDDVGELRAIEPSEGMRAQFAKTTIPASADDTSPTTAGDSTSPTITVADGHFASLPVPDGWADVIVIAQAFHWCPDHAAAVAEFARALRRGGPLVLVWNLEDRDAAPWVAQLRDRIERHEQGAPQFRLGLWRAFAETREWRDNFAARPPGVGGEEEQKEGGEGAGVDFDEQKEEVGGGEAIPHTTTHTHAFALPATRALAIDRACSKSYVATLPAGAKAEVIADVRAILDRAEGMAWLDRARGVFAYPYKATVVVGWRV
ncbi:S-adenosyl-L-methionine-dependent methyltransferase [Schizophyllum fasciatum]